MLSSTFLAFLECTNTHSATLALLLGAAKASLLLATLQRPVYNVHSATAGNLIVPMALLRTA